MPLFSPLLSTSSAADMFIYFHCNPLKNNKKKQQQIKTFSKIQNKQIRKNQHKSCFIHKLKNLLIKMISPHRWRPARTRSVRLCDHAWVIREGVVWRLGWIIRLMWCCSALRLRHEARRAAEEKDTWSLRSPCFSQRGI